MAKEMERRPDAVPAGRDPEGGTEDGYAGMSVLVHEIPEDYHPVPPRTAPYKPEWQRWYSYFAQVLTVPLWALKWSLTYWYRALFVSVSVLTILIIIRTR